jgi:hypothetical protein
MKKLLVATIAVLSLGAVHAAGTHEHGAGKIDVVIEKDGLSIALELPLDSLVGFERAPANDKERAALAEAGRRLNDYAALFALPAGADCKSSALSVTLPFQKGAPAGAHGDVDASYGFRCSNMAALKSVETSLFRQFPRLYRLELQRIGPAGQAGGRLTPKKPVVSW